MATDSSRPTKQQLASRLRAVTHHRRVPLGADVEARTGYSLADYTDAFGSYADAIKVVDPYAPAGEVELGLLPQKWRHECPHGHSTWAPEDGEFSCLACWRDSDIDSDRFGYLVDGYTGEKIPFDAFVIRRAGSKRSI